MLGIKAGRGADGKPPTPTKTKKEIEAEELAAVEKKRALKEEERLADRLR